MNYTDTRVSSFPPEFLPREIIISRKDKPETGIPVIFRHENYRRKFSGTNLHDGNFSQSLQKT